MFERIPWQALHPSEGRFNLTPIQEILDQLNEGEYLRLHIVGGNACPSWLADRVGTVRMYHSFSDTSYDLPRYWTTEFQQQWEALVAALGDAFDDDPRFVSVNVAGASGKYDEPFILGDDDSAKRAEAAGLNRESMRRAILDMTSVTAGAVPHTVVDLSAHVNWQYPTSSGMGYGDFPDMRDEILQPLAHDLARQLAVSYHGWGPSRLTGPEPPDEAKSLPSYLRGRAEAGEKVGLQMGLNSSADGEITPELRQRAVETGVQLGAVWFEHSGGFAYFANPSEYHEWDARLKGEA